MGDANHLYKNGKFHHNSLRFPTECNIRHKQVYKPHPFTRQHLGLFLPETLHGIGQGLSNFVDNLGEVSYDVNMESERATAVVALNSLSKISTRKLTIKKPMTNGSTRLAIRIANKLEKDRLSYMRAIQKECDKLEINFRDRFPSDDVIENISFKWLQDRSQNN